MPAVRVNPESCKKPEDEETFHRLRRQMDEELHIRITITAVRGTNALGETMPQMQFSINPGKVEGAAPPGFLPQMLHGEANG